MFIPLTGFPWRHQSLGLISIDTFLLNDRQVLSNNTDLWCCYVIQEALVLRDIENVTLLIIPPAFGF